MRIILILAAAIGLTTALHGSMATQAQAPLAIRLVSPAAGATVSAPVRLQVEVGGGVIGPLGTTAPGDLHYHVLVDIDPATVIQPGQPLPTGRAEVIHTDDLNLSLGSLAPGPHTITVILTRADHVPLSPNIQHQATFNVAAAAAGGMSAGSTSAAPAPTEAAGQPAAPAALARTGRRATADAAPAPWGGLAALVLVAGGALAALAVRRRAARWS